MIDAAQAECDRIFESVVLPVARHLKEAAALVEFIEDQAAHWATRAADPMPCRSPPRSPLSSMSVRRKSSTQW
jgi:hypothetical protein